MTPHWQYTTLDECTSTFYPARALPAWHAVQAHLQTKGRGRFQRTWFGEHGGLWISYNVPIDESKELPWGQLPLVAGAALIRSLHQYHIPQLRLRWPNDLLVGRAKLGGILVERPSASVATIGIGVNMHNNTAALHGKTSDPVTRLRDLITSHCPSVDEYRDVLGSTLSEVYHAFTQHGMHALQADLHTAWAGARPVVAITDTARHVGFFQGIDDSGSPILCDALGNTSIIPGIEINRLVEIGA